MPRVPVPREPKAPTRRRSGDYDNHHRRSGDYNHYQQHSHAPHHSRSASHGNHNPATRRISTLTGHIIAAVGEFAGTFMFLYFAFLGQIMIVTQAGEAATANGLASSQQNIFVALVYGFSLLVNVWAFYRISGGLFNPAVRTYTSP